MALVTRRTTCRVCDGPLSLLLDLGDLPLANGFRREVDPPTPVAPCRVMVCNGCRHVQLGDTVNPDLVFRSYPFRAGASSGWKAHVHDFAAAQGTPGFAVDIGSNDGTMLAALASQGWNVLGVDPSLENNAEHGYATLTGYWNPETASRVLRHGRPNLITAFNVLGHVDDPSDFLRTANNTLAPNGRIVVETPWVVPIIQKGTYDTFYHEHLSTWGIRPLCRAAFQAGLVLTGLDVVPVHGGSLRATFQRDGVAPASMRTAWAEEERALRPMLLEAFPFKVQDAQRRLGEWMEDRAREKDLVVGYGATARGNVLLNTIPALGGLASIVDDTPEKHGLLTPGVPLAVERPGKWLRGVDSMLALSYPWASKMLEQARAYGFKGPMYVPFHGELA